MNPISASVLVFLGGGAGAVLRHLLGSLFRHQGWNAAFPWHTFLINVVGSFVLGIVAVQFRDRHSIGFLLLGVGICGGFTTYSGFSLETVEMIESNRFATAIAYVSGAMIAPVIGMWLGLTLARAAG